MAKVTLEHPIEKVRENLEEKYNNKRSLKRILGIFKKLNLKEIFKKSDVITKYHLYSELDEPKGIFYFQFKDEEGNILAEMYTYLWSLPKKDFETFMIIYENGKPAYIFSRAHYNTVVWKLDQKKSLKKLKKDCEPYFTDPWHTPLFKNAECIIIGDSKGKIALTTASVSDEILKLTEYILKSRKYETKEVKACSSIPNYEFSEEDIKKLQEIAKNIYHTNKGIKT